MVFIGIPAEAFLWHIFYFGSNFRSGNPRFSILRTIIHSVYAGSADNDTVISDVFLYRI